LVSLRLNFPNPEVADPYSNPTRATKKMTRSRSKNFNPDQSLIQILALPGIPLALGCHKVVQKIIKRLPARKKSLHDLVSHRRFDKKILLHKANKKCQLKHEIVSDF